MATNEALATAVERFQDFLAVHSGDDRLEATDACVTFGEFVGLSAEQQNFVLDLVDALGVSLGVDSDHPVASGLYFGILIGLLAAQDSGLNSHSDA